MRVAGVELALHAKEAGLHVDLHLVGNQRHALVAQGLSLPEGGDVADLPLGLLRDVKDVAVALLKEVQLLEHKAQRVLGEDRCRLVGTGLVAGDGRLGLDVDGHVVEDVLEHQRAAHDRGEMLGLTVGLGGEDGALGVDVGLLVDDLLAVGLHARGELTEMRDVLHGVPFLSDTIGFHAPCPRVFLLRYILPSELA